MLLKAPSLVNSSFMNPYQLSVTADSFKQRKNLRPSFAVEVAEPYFGYISQGQKESPTRTIFTKKRFDGDRSKLSWFERLLFTSFLRLKKGKIEFVEYPNHLLEEGFREKINRLTDPKVAIDIGTSRFKILLARPDQALRVIKIPMPLIQRLTPKSTDPLPVFKPYKIWGVQTGWRLPRLERTQQQHDKFSNFVTVTMQLNILLSFAEMYLKTHGLKGLRDDSVMPVATEGFRKLVNNRVYPRLQKTLTSFLDVYGIDIISPDEESRLLHKTLTHGLSEERVRQSLAVDIGGGSTDCAYVQDSDATGSGGIEVVPLGFQLGHRVRERALNSEKSIDVFDKDDLMTLAPIFRKNIKEKIERIGPLPKYVDHLLTDFKPKFVDYLASQCPGRDFFATSKSPQPLTRDDIKSVLLSQSALDDYKQRNKNARDGDYFEKKPVRLLLLWVLMDELKIDKLWVGSSGGMKMAVLEQLIETGRSKQPDSNIKMTFNKIFNNLFGPKKTL